MEDTLTDSEKYMIRAYSNRPVQVICLLVNKLRKDGSRIHENDVESYLTDNWGPVKTKVGRKRIPRVEVPVVKETHFKSTLRTPRETGEFVDCHEWDLYYK